jgi:UDPglucose 6-dehydrogenase
VEYLPIAALERHYIPLSGRGIEGPMAARIGIIGMGHVGKAMYDLFRSHAGIVTFDARGHGDYPAGDLAACDLGVICVDTPEGADGECDVTNVGEAVNRLPISRVLIKSTVAPGTTDLLARSTGKQICFSPEYVGESSYYHPFWAAGVRDVPFVILGGPPSARRWLIDLLLPVLGPTKVYFQCSALEAEVIKYMENAYFATKVSFVNEFARICQAVGADWHTVREGWLLDPRVEPMHTAVFAGSPGFAGKCLPKDLSAIIQASAAAGYAPALLAEVLRSNRRFRGGEADGLPSPGTGGTGRNPPAGRPPQPA